MKKTLILMMTSIFIFSGAVQSAPEFSPGVRDAFRKMQERVKSGNREKDTLIKDLTPLAEGGDPVAQFFVALLTPPSQMDRKTRLKYLHQSASAGCAGAAGVIGGYALEENKTTQALYWLKFAAKEGDGFSKVLLANLYLDGKDGMKQDMAEGYAWLLLAKEHAVPQSAGMAAQMKLLQLESDSRIDAEIRHVAESRYRDLAKEYVVQPVYPCGQSVP